MALNKVKNGQLLSDYVVVLAEKKLDESAKCVLVYQYEVEIQNRLADEKASLKEMVEEASFYLLQNEGNRVNLFHQVWATLRPWAQGGEEEVKDIQRALTHALKGKIINTKTEKAA